MAKSNINKHSEVSDMLAITVGLTLIVVILVTVLSALGNFFDNFYNNDKKKAFSNNTKFICTPNLVRNKEFYHVAQKDGWVIYKEYFKKEDLLFEINSCKEDE
ncbi:MAG: hypothetical protein NTZ60_00775 [Campylobacterales bacterium]|nr:hypothetical protein [Campylobacterales bacterium]